MKKMQQLHFRKKVQPAPPADQAVGEEGGGGDDGGGGDGDGN